MQPVLGYTAPSRFIQRRTQTKHRQAQSPTAAIPEPGLEPGSRLPASGSHSPHPHQLPAAGPQDGKWWGGG